MIDAELLSILCCPENHQALSIAEPKLIEELNRRVTAKELKNREGQLVEETLDGGLLREDQSILYPIRKGIPVLLINEGIPLPAGTSRAEAPGS